MSTTQNQLVPSATEVPGSPVQTPGVVARTVYATSYCLSFGVAFPAMLVVSLLPTHNAVGFGLCDGARAARDAQQRVQTRTALAAAAAKDKVGDAYASVAARVSKRVESLEDAVAERRYRRRVATT